MHVLIVEDHADLAANLGDYLEQHGVVVDYAADGLSGLHLAVTQRFDAAIVDISLPALDGLALCRRLRQEGQGNLPVIMLTARDTERDKLAGFDAGADDYLTKPFSMPELLARLKALVRRAQSDNGAVLTVADLTFDTRTLIARRGERRLQLRPTELRLLELLMRAAPAVVSRQDIERKLWPDGAPESDAALRGHIHALRTEIDRDSGARLLHTVHGMGYRLGEIDA